MDVFHLNLSSKSVCLCWPSLSLIVTGLIYQFTNTRLLGQNTFCHQCQSSPNVTYLAQTCHHSVWVPGCGLCCSAPTGNGSSLLSKGLWHTLLTATAAGPPAELLTQLSVVFAPQSGGFGCPGSLCSARAPPEPQLCHTWPGPLTKVRRCGALGAPGSAARGSSAFLCHPADKVTSKQPCLEHGWKGMTVSVQTRKLRTRTREFGREGLKHSKAHGESLGRHLCFMFAI